MHPRFRLPFALVFLILSGCLRSGTGTCRLDEFVDTLVAAPGLESSHVGEGGHPSRKFQMLDSLRKCGAPDDWEKLTRHANGTVRAYAFWALSLDSSPHLLKLALEHIHDTDSISFTAGCLISNRRVGDVIFDLLIPLPEGEYGLNLTSTKDRRLDSNEAFLLDSALIASNSALTSRMDALVRISPRPSARPIILRYVMGNRSPRGSCYMCGMSALSRYRRNEDVGRILLFMANPESLQTPFPLAVYESFPHPAFLPPLIRRYRAALAKDAHGWAIASLEPALAEYGPEIAIPLLRELFRLPRGSTMRVIDMLDLSLQEPPDYKRYEALNSMFEVANNAKDPRYDTLLWQLWEEDGLAPFHTLDGPALEDFLVMSHLEAIDSARAAPLYVKELWRHPSRILSSYMNDSLDSITAIGIEHMLRLAERSHPGSAERWLVEQIPRGENVEFLLLERLLPPRIGSRRIQDALLRKISSTRSRGELFSLGKTLAKERSPRIIVAIDSAIRRNTMLDTTTTAAKLRAFLRDSIQITAHR